MQVMGLGIPRSRGRELKRIYQEGGSSDSGRPGDDDPKGLRIDRMITTRRGRASLIILGRRFWTGKGDPEKVRKNRQLA